MSKYTLVSNGVVDGVLPTGVLPTAAQSPGQRSEADRQAMLEAELQALRHPKTGKVGEARSWSYLATEGGKGKDAGRKK